MPVALEMAQPKETSNHEKPSAEEDRGAKDDQAHQARREACHRGLPGNAEAAAVEAKPAKVEATDTRVIKLLVDRNPRRGGRHVLFAIIMACDDAPVATAIEKGARRQPRSRPCATRGFG
jgi:hypothetical protein